LKPVVVDASLALSFVLEDENSSTFLRLLEEVQKGQVQLLAASHWSLELANALLQASRKGRLPKKDRLLAWDFLSGIPASAESGHRPAAVLFDLADSERLSAYDAAYLALALDRRALLATSDGKLAAAARRRRCLWEAA